jgi:hypothetical protein
MSCPRTIFGRSEGKDVQRTAKELKGPFFGRFPREALRGKRREALQFIDPQIEGKEWHLESSPCPRTGK